MKARESPCVHCCLASQRTPEDVRRYFYIGNSNGFYKPLANHLRALAGRSTRPRSGFGARMSAISLFALRLSRKPLDSLCFSISARASAALAGSRPTALGRHPTEEERAMKKVLSLLAIVAVVACGGRTADTNLPAGMGGIKVQLHGLTPGGTTMGEIIIQNVFDPSQIILQNCVAKPETLNGMAFCDEMNVLPPGVYEIKVESQTGCRMTQDHYKAVVNAGQTTEVRIDLVCDGGNAAGGLDVVVTENHYPQIDNITFNFQSGLPGNKFICQFATRPTVVTLQVEDAETPCAGLTAQWSLDGAVVPVPTNLISAVAGPIDTAGVCTFTETINQSAPIGTYNLDVLLSDGTLTTTFGYIVHIIDCGNPAPVDQLIDCDGSATGGSGCAGAPGVPFDPRLTVGATLSDFPSSAFELAGLDWMDNDGNQQWTFGVDSLMAEGEQCGPGAVKNGVFDDHTGAHDCPVVQGAPALFDGQQVSCDIEINFQWLGWSCASPVSHIRYFDVNGNGQYDLGEPLVLDTNNDGIYN